MHAIRFYNFINQTKTNFITIFIILLTYLPDSIYHRNKPTIRMSDNTLRLVGFF